VFEFIFSSVGGRRRFSAGGCEKSTATFKLQLRGRSIEDRAVGLNGRRDVESHRTWTAIVLQMRGKSYRWPTFSELMNWTVDLACRDVPLREIS